MFYSWMRQTLQLVGADDGPDERQRIVDNPMFWKRALPEFVGDLSGKHTPHSLFVQERIRHGKFHSEFNNVCVFGSHHFHGILSDTANFSMQETDQDRLESRVDYHLAHPPGEAVRIPLIERVAPHEYVCTTRHLDNDAVIRIADPVFFGSPIEPDNWGMWLLNGLSSAQFYCDHGAGARYLCWIRFEWQRNLLNFMGIPDDEIIVQQPWQVYDCSRLTCEQYTKIDLIPTASDRVVLAGVRDRCGPPAGPRYEKIFISRRAFTRKHGYRALLNEDELIAALEAIGFVTIEPEALSMQDQVRIFGAAKIVVGLGGAAMFNTVFCDEGTRIVSIEGSTAFLDNHAGLFAGLGLRYGVLLGRQDPTDPTEVHKRWTIDVPEAVRYIDGFT